MLRSPMRAATSISTEREAALKKLSDNHYEAQDAGVTISLTINADGSPSISYMGLGGANAVCVISGGTRAAIDR